MKNPSTLLAGLFAGAAAGLALLGLLTLDSLSTVSLKQFMLPHLSLAEIVHDPLLRDRHLEPLVPALIVAHAGLILLAVALAAIVTARAKGQPWAPRLALGLGGVSFYVAHFNFVHPGGPLTAANLGVRALDYVAVVALATGVSSLVHFFLLFPKKYDIGEFNAFMLRNLDRQLAKLATSRWPWRRRTAQPAGVERSKKALAGQLRFWQWTQSRGYLLTVAGTGWLLLALLPVAAPMDGTPAIVAAVLCLLAGYGSFILGMIAAVFAGNVLQWHGREGEPAVRWQAAVISRSLLVAIWIPLGLIIAAMVLVMTTHSMTSMGLIILSFPVGVPMVALVFIVSVGIATWRAGSDSA
jgi:hypothetical protein